jgi:hypothetical protein
LSKSTFVSMAAIAMVIASAMASACYDPAHQDAVAQLGGEVDGVPKGPTHRAGQPCTTCHGGDGPGDPQFVVAGTVFTTRGSTEALVGANIVITDSHGDSRTILSNIAGNFYIESDNWSPTFPLSVSINANGTTKNMITHIGRDGGCGTCHRGAGDNTFMPGVFLKDL